MRRALATIVVAAACHGGGPPRPAIVQERATPASLLAYVPADTGAILVFDGRTPTGHAMLEAWAPAMVKSAEAAERLIAAEHSGPNDQLPVAFAKALLAMTPAERARVGLSTQLEAVAYLWGLAPVLRVRGDGAFLLERAGAAAAAAGYALPIEHRGAHAYVTATIGPHERLVIVFEPDQIALGFVDDPTVVIDHLVGDAPPAAALSRERLSARIGAGGDPVALFDPPAIGRVFAAGGAGVRRVDPDIKPACAAALGVAFAEMARVGLTSELGATTRDTTVALSPAPGIAAWLRRNAGTVPRWPPPQADTMVLGVGVALGPAVAAIAAGTDAYDLAVKPCGYSPIGFGANLQGGVMAGLAPIEGVTIVVRGTEPAQVRVGVVLGLRDPIAFWRWIMAMTGINAPPASIGGSLDLPAGPQTVHVVFDRDAIGLGLRGFTTAEVRAILAAPPGPRSAFTAWLDPDVSRAVGVALDSSGAEEAPGPFSLLGNAALDLVVEGDSVQLRIHEQIDPESQRSTY